MVDDEVTAFVGAGETVTASDAPSVASALKDAEAGAVAVEGRVPRVGAEVDELRVLGESPEVGDSMFVLEAPLALIAIDRLASALAEDVSGAPETAGEADADNDEAIEPASNALGEVVSVGTPWPTSDIDGLGEDVRTSEGESDAVEVGALETAGVGDSSAEAIVVAVVVVV